MDQYSVVHEWHTWLLLLRETTAPPALWGVQTYLWSIYVSSCVGTLALIWKVMGNCKPAVLGLLLLPATGAQQGHLAGTNGTIVYYIQWMDMAIACFGISTAWLVVWKPLCLDPSDGVFGRFDLAALCGCHTLNVCCCCCCSICTWHKSALHLSDCSA